MSNEKRETYVNFKDIVEENGKTIEQNNLTKTHKIPIGSLVEVKTSEWYGKGACIKSHARLFVVGHERDCDGTPLYTLCQRQDPENQFQSLSDLSNGYLSVKTLQFLAGCFGMYESGLSEESLTLVERTPDLDRGVGILEWKEGE